MGGWIICGKPRGATARQLLLRIPITPGGTPGPIETVAERLRGDDFAIGSSGALYIATHTAQTVMRLDDTRARATLAGPEQGAAGATACAFGRTPGGVNALYVTTTGGLLAPHHGVVQEAKLLRLEVGEAGASRGAPPRRTGLRRESDAALREAELGQ